MTSFGNTGFKKILLLIVFVVIVIVAFLGIKYLLFSGQLNYTKGRAIAEVNGIVVYEGDLTQRLDSLGRGKKIKVEDLPESMVKAMVLEVIVNKQIDKEAKKLDYYKNKEIVDLVDNFKKSIIRDKYLNDKVYINITDADVKKEYDKIVKDLSTKEERKIKHILVEDEEEIERVRRSVLRSGNFEKVAAEKSIDTASGENGGDIGYVLKEELVPEFGDLAFILKVGEISRPVKTQYGWHIIKVEDIRPAKFLPFNDVKDSIRQSLQQNAVQKYLAELTKNKEVKFNIKLNKNATSNLPIEINQPAAGEGIIAQ